VVWAESLAEAVPTETNRAFHKKLLQLQSEIRRVTLTVQPSASSHEEEDKQRKRDHRTSKKKTSGRIFFSKYILPGQSTEDLNASRFGSPSKPTQTKLVEKCLSNLQCRSSRTRRSRPFSPDSQRKVSVL
jgi:hypothetical protein